VTAPRHPLPVIPRLMRPAVAAAYLGISESLLRTLPLTPRRMGERVVVYDRHDLDAYADALPYGGTAGEDQICDDADKAFGL
jgi:hypothetical protein